MKTEQKLQYYEYYSTVLGEITVATNEEAVTFISLLGKKPVGEKKRTALSDELMFQLEEYFGGKRREFDIPLCPSGTEFQKKVWDKLREIPYGETCTYQKIAESLGNPNACRAVGMANHKNPIMILIPCHRVIGANGALTGYAGGLHRKKWLLELEQADIIKASCI